MHIHIRKGNFKKEKEERVEWREGEKTQSTLHPQHFTHKALAAIILWVPHWERAKHWCSHGRLGRMGRMSLINPPHLLKLQIQQRPSSSFHQSLNSPILPSSWAKAERQTVEGWVCGWRHLHYTCAHGCHSPGHSFRRHFSWFSEHCTYSGAFQHEKSWETFPERMTISKKLASEANLGSLGPLSNILIP